MPCPDVVEVRIFDSGKGIPDENLAQIFDTVRHDEAARHGVGLPIARTIIESYGGTIWAENRMRGAMFSFTLPLVGAA